MKIKERVIRYLLIARYWVPFLGNWLLIRQLHKAYAEYKKSVEQLTAIKAGEMTFRDTGMNVSFESWIAPHLAASAYEMLDEKKADNYVELKLYHPKDKPGHWITVLVQRCSGKTPGEKAAKAIEERDAAIIRVADLESLAAYRMQKIDEWEAIATESDARVTELEAEILKFSHDIASNWDHDDDAHRYNTQCFVCMAEKMEAKHSKSTLKDVDAHD